MAKERLSKLQKWILTNCYQTNGDKVYTAMKKLDILRYFKSTYTIGSCEFPITNRFKGFFTAKEYNKINSTISRSLKSLRDKGYVKLLGHTGRKDTFNFEVIADDMDGKTKEEYLEKYKNVDTVDAIKDYKKWIKKSEDTAVEIEGKCCPHKTKIVILTEKGLEIAKKLLNVK